MDTVTSEKRSEVMSKIRSKDTRPEMLIRKLIFSHGYRYRLHYKNLPGKPDIVFPSRKKVVFVHGCFWHQHNKCRDGKLPKSKLSYWKPKLEKNVFRDKDHQVKLKKLGWQYLIIWECELKDIVSLENKIINFLG
jgi:DNA mismatch endonuclease (patch repair protein)